MADADLKTVIAGLSAERRRFLLQRSDAEGLRHLGLHLGLIAACTGLIMIQFPLEPLIMLAQGILIGFLFTTLHETVHRTPFRSRGLNDRVGSLCGFLVFLGPQWFRYFHLAHHRYTNEPGRDPELATQRPATVWQYLWYLSGVPDWVGRFRVLVRNAARNNHDSFVPSHRRSIVKREARIQLGLYLGLLLLSILASSTILVSVWLAPLLLGGPFLRALLLAEHGGCPHVSSIFENTRTTFTTVVVRFVAWNMPYHVEHHAYPAVPFHKLPDFHEHTKAHLAQTENGYLRFNRQYLVDCRA